ncbi:MAG: cytochrome P450, partial [Rhodospirillales bacterium]|nr:cytochrome P450 [Rhodospirillales bacterium]
MNDTTTATAEILQDVEDYLLGRRPDYLASPYGFYAKYRESQPVLRTPAIALVFGFEHSRAVLRDPRTFSSRRRAGSRNDHALAQMTPELAIRAQHVLDFVDGWMLGQDDPNHARLRKIVQRAFTPARVNALADEIRVVSRQLLDQMDPSQTVDLIDCFAYQLPIIVIGRMLGLRPEEFPTLREWSRAIAVFQGTEFQPSSVDAAHAAVEGFAAYVDDYVRTRHVAGVTDNLLDALIEAEADGERLTTAEVVSNFGLLVFAGHETTTNLIANAVRSLVRNPEQFQLLRDGGVSIQIALEELLRYDSSVQAAHRVATVDTEIGGVPIAKGTRVRLAIGSTHHDPRIFTDPD